MSATDRHAEAQRTGSGAARYALRLYIAGDSVRSVAALDNMRRLIADGLADRLDLEVVDLHADPMRAQRDDIIALPTLIRTAPPPVCRVIGDLTDHEAVRRALNLV